MNGKRIAGEKAVDFVKDGMKLGLGTGSTVYWTIMKIGQLVQQGLDVQCAATSRETKQLAGKLGISLIPPSELIDLDLAIDGADEVDSHLNLIKGGGGALLREKIVASSSKQFIVVVDETKYVPVLGSFPLPVEVVPFGWKATRHKIQRLGCVPTLRMGTAGDPFVTDNGNYILDCKFDAIDSPEDVSTALNDIPGVVDNGLFVRMADAAVIGLQSGVEIKIPGDGNLE